MAALLGTSFIPSYAAFSAERPFRRARSCERGFKSNSWLCYCVNDFQSANFSYEFLHIFHFHRSRSVSKVISDSSEIKNKRFRNIRKNITTGRVSDVCFITIIRKTLFRVFKLSSIELFARFQLLVLLKRFCAQHSDIQIPQPKQAYKAITASYHPIYLPS